ncbi:hypothetical protein SEA_REDFIELD_9 [Microbacterium phage Redfield]|uniref:Uncharacterized protein n=4 Tax=Ilzatvirus hamlet TaxID=2560591 RepID=A0A345MEH8_9CAUD|nr:hypothetical protein PBI_PEPPINO_9 [Microbacterium phage Peppino]AUX83222.1 hypothetical protein PBI_RACCOON_9 [Microbacterium phage Raccoon]AXH46399.1 hypothetical protein SEA_REDFIELD_9 [Microbacterium phage Redfield]AXH68959.1 hypothetical protein SCHNAPSIDEE_9 [Microbacterium phage Schnapsidee]
MDELNALLQNLPGFTLLTETQKQAALTGAQVPDSFGIWPGEEGYEVTYDVYFAALTLLGFLMAQPVVRQTSSEGTSIAVDAPDWRALATYYRSQSVICNATGNGILQRVTIPDVPHVRKTDMRGDQHGYGDVDTDLS